MATILNGRRHDWVSVKIILPQVGKKPLTVSAITLPDFARAKEHVYGTGMENIGFTFDTLKPGEGEFTILQSEADEIFVFTNAVLSDVGMPIIVSFVDIGLIPRTDTYSGCHFTKVQQTVAQGTDPARTTITWKPDSALINGVPIITPRA